MDFSPRVNLDVSALIALVADLNHLIPTSLIAVGQHKSLGLTELNSGDDKPYKPDSILSNGLQIKPQQMIL
ncbi:unnamed protein product [Protopolystoma xenopodis]|uniref:Uncharacterized protein n=1 Tax=Protopolystoma xenopodis TaxID=117903 RepID=A0A3S5AX31_9PLAT|nr:unnamed protein product [Protopolystoma xenopodis]